MGDTSTDAVDAVGRDTAFFGYDAVGHLLFANNSSARIARTYNRNGTLATDTLRIATGHITDQDFTVHVYGLGYGYDLDGHRTVLAEGGTDTVRYAYDAQSGLLDSLVAATGTRFHYDMASGSSNSVASPPARPTVSRRSPPTTVMPASSPG